MRILISLASLLLGAGAVAGCASRQPPSGSAMPPDSLPLSACQKADAMWQDKIVPTVYGTLPPLTSPGLWDLFTLARTSFTLRSLTNDDDELDPGHRKLVHAFGAEARFRLVTRKGARAYTGIYQSGADCVIGRLSLATKPSETSMVPALALKFFVTGRTSVNLHLMNSTDGQKSGNFFAMPFSNIIPTPDSFAKRMLQELFRNAAIAFGAKDTDPTHLTVEHLAALQVDGTAVQAPRSPFRLVFQPTPAATALMKQASLATDFRTSLARFPAGEAMYDVYAFDEGERFDNLAAGNLVGQLIPTTSIVASSFGDEKLNFQHNMEK